MTGEQDYDAAVERMVGTAVEQGFSRTVTDPDALRVIGAVLAAAELRRAARAGSAYRTTEAHGTPHEQ
jgi:hypothetical protein